MNLYNNLQKKLEKQREKKIIEEQQKHLIPWQVSKNSRKIIGDKFKDEKPIYERTLELAEKKKREIENASRKMEIQKENEMKKLKTRWNNQKKINKESFEGFIEKQMLWEHNKQTKVTILREEYDEIMKKAIEETMFKPDIGKRPISIAKKSNNDGKRVHERLYDYNDELKNKKANLEKKNIPKFIPIINKKLPKYLVNKSKAKNEDMFFGENRNQIDYSNYSNDLEFQDDINEDFENNLKNFINVDNPYANIKLNENFNNITADKKDKRTIEKNSIIVNRRNSAPLERNITNPKNNMLKNKLEKKDFDLNNKGLKSDFNNIYAGNNLKNLLNNKQEINKEIEPKSKISQEIVYRNLSNGKINKKLSDKFPLERFSVPVNSIKINYPINNKDVNISMNEPNNKIVKRLNSMIPESKNKIDNNLDMKMNVNKHPVVYQQSYDSPLNHNFEPEKDDANNISRLIMIDDSINQNNNDMAIRKESINHNIGNNNRNKKRVSTSVIEENRGKNLIMNSLNKQESLNNKLIGNNNKIVYGHEKRGTVNPNEAFAFNNYKNAMNLYENIGNFKNKL